MLLQISKKLYPFVYLTDETGVNKYFTVFFRLTQIAAAGVISFILILPVKTDAQNIRNNSQPVFNHAALCANDLQKTASFYRDVIGLTEIANPFRDSKHIWFKIGNGLALHIIQGNCPQTKHDISIHLCFSVSSLSAFMQHLNKMHVRFGNWAGKPGKFEVRPDGVRQIYLQDPDGSWVEVNDAK